MIDKHGYIKIDALATPEILKARLRHIPDWQWPERWWGEMCLLMEKPSPTSNPETRSESEPTNNLYRHHRSRISEETRKRRAQYRQSTNPKE